MKDNDQQLKDDLKFMGFGESIYPKMEIKLAEGLDNFTLPYTAEIMNNKYHAEISINRKATSERYYVNNFRATVTFPDGSHRSATFYNNYGKGVKAKESYNLLDGRSVEKEYLRKLEPLELERYKRELKLPAEQRGLKENWTKPPTYIAWQKFDFEKLDKNGEYTVLKFHEKYGFDLKEALGKYNIAELDGGEKEKDLIQSLRKGNLQSISVNGTDGQQHKMFIEANPEKRVMNLYNSQFQPVQKEQLHLYQKKDLSQTQSQGQEQSQSKNKEQKQDIKQSDSEDGPVKRTRQRKKNIE